MGNRLYWFFRNVSAIFLRMLLSPILLAKWFYFAMKTAFTSDGSEYFLYPWEKGFWSDGDEDE